MNSITYIRDMNTRHKNKLLYAKYRTYLFRATPLVHNDRDSHIRNRTSNRKRTGSILHVSVRSCANPAISKCEHKLHAENPCVLPLVTCHRGFFGW